MKTIAKSKVVVNDRDYKTFIGTPRGWGYWAFHMGDDVVFFSGMYADAKKAAIAEAAKRGISSIKLGK